jgi:putative membrane protein
MTGLIVRFLAAAGGLWLAERLLGGVDVSGWQTLLLAALALGLANAIVRPIVVLLTLPITLVTLGLFLLVVNGLMVALVAWLLDGFRVDGLITAILASLIVSVVTWIAQAVFDRD